MLNLIYITDNCDVAKIAQNCGVDTLFVDMEYIGKANRQASRDTVLNHHTIKDVKSIKSCLTSSKLLVRVNPIHQDIPGVLSNEDEINVAINAGADAVMLPYFKTVSEAKKFVNIVGNRCKSVLLFETKEAVSAIDEILCSISFDYAYIGLNDLSLSMNKKFMFELMLDGTVENLSKKLARSNIKFGIGGIAKLGSGMVPAEYVIKELYRLGASATILSRTFCNYDKYDDIKQIDNVFSREVSKIRKLELECISGSDKYFLDNKKELDAKIEEIKLNF